MESSLRKIAWLPLVWALAASSPAPAHAQAHTYTYRTRTVIPAPPVIEYSYRPQWAAVPGTNVLMIRGQRPGYDVFSYGSNYYLYNGGYWYEAIEWDGPYTSIGESEVPRAIHYVPQREWNSYPSAWSSVTEVDESYEDSGGYYDSATDTYKYNSDYDRNGYRLSDRSYNPRYDQRNYRTVDVSSAPPPPQIYFRENPHWVKVAGTGVMVVREDERPNVDLFYQGGNYYVYDSGFWYRSDGWNGPYAAVDARNVPRALRAVPRSQWISYPSSWDGRVYRVTTTTKRTSAKTTSRRY